MAHVSEKKILVVDDEPDVRDFISTCLEDGGFQVSTAFDGVDALEKIEKSAPDLITLDLIMPRMSGVGVLRKLRENEKWKKIPVVIITAHAKDEMGEEDIKALQKEEIAPVPEHIIEKPITPIKLVTSVAKILDVKLDLGVTEERQDIVEEMKSASPEKLKEIQKILNK